MTNPVPTEGREGRDLLAELKLSSTSAYLMINGWAYLVMPRSNENDTLLRSFAEASDPMAAVKAWRS